VTARLLRTLVVSAVALAVPAWFVIRDHAAGRTWTNDVRTLGLFAITLFVVIVPFVLLSHSPQMGRLRRLRRLTVAVAFGGFSIYGASWIFASISGVSREAVQALGVGTVALLIGALALGLVSVWNKNMYDSLFRPVDERVIVRRNETFAIAFQVLALACAIEAVVWFARGSIALPKTVDFPTFFFATDLLLVISLPAAILAWGDPDTVEDRDYPTRAVSRKG